MSIISQVSKEKAPADLKQIYEQINKKMGKVPNMFLHMGNSTPVLLSYFLESDLANKTSIPTPLREAISLTVAEINGCNYCLAAHSALAKMHGYDEEKIKVARTGYSADAKENAILQFAKKIVEKRGSLEPREIEEVKKAGVSDKEIVEILFLVHLDIFTNYFNNLVGPEIDFPKAPKLGELQSR